MEKEALDNLLNLPKPRYEADLPLIFPLLWGLRPVGNYAPEGRGQEPVLSLSKE